MGKHSILPPSGAHRWTNCTPSARLEQEFESTESEAAREGTAAHALCEHKLKKALRMRSKRPVPDYDSDEIRKGPGTDYGRTQYVPVGIYTIVEVKSGKGFFAL